LRAAIDALPPGVTAALFIPCDQPLLDAATLSRLVQAHAAGAPVVVPVHGGRRGAPVLFARSLWGELAKLRGETGGRDLLAGLGDRAVTVELPGVEPLLDVDTVEELERLEAENGRR
jgi:CTP:molybdopterin cytidylyltransferase MocA